MPKRKPWRIVTRHRRKETSDGRYRVFRSWEQWACYRVPNGSGICFSPCRAQTLREMESKLESHYRRRGFAPRDASGEGE